MTALESQFDDLRMRTFIDEMLPERRVACLKAFNFVIDHIASNPESHEAIDNVLWLVTQIWNVDLEDPKMDISGVDAVRRDDRIRGILFGISEIEQHLLDPKTLRATVARLDQQKPEPEE